MRVRVPALAGLVLRVTRPWAGGAGHRCRRGRRRPPPSTRSARGRPSRRWTTAATRSTRPSRPPPCSASPSRSRAASAAAASWSSAPPTASSPAIGGRETAPAAMRPDSFFEDGAPLGVPRRSLQRPVGRRPRHGAHMEQGADRARHAGPCAARCRPACASRARASRSTRSSRRRSRPTSRASTTSRPRAALFLDPDGTPLRRRRHAPQPRPRPRLRAHRAPRLQGLLRGSDRARDRRGRAAPAGCAGRRSRLAARAADRARRPQTTARACARPPSSSFAGVDIVGHGPAVQRRLHGRRDPEHPRRLRPRLPPTARARCTCCSRPRGSPSPTAAPSSPTRPTSTSRSPGCCPP